MDRSSSPGSTRTCDVLFLVKNDSGLGHIRRAVLLSKELQRIGVSSVIVSQASSLVLFNDPDLRVVNFPLMERLKSSAAEEAYSALLDAVAARLDPKLVVEDTYPDHRYLSVPSLRSLPRLLVLRRLDPVSFEHVRAQGGFSPYDRVLMVQERSDFEAEPHTTASRRLVASSGRFNFFGPVFHEPGEDELRQVDRTYDLGEQPLVVVTAGSGGDQLNDAYSERLFGNAVRAAIRCQERGLSTRFVLVLGPYYRGKALTPPPNVEVINFEPRLAALMHRAAVVVMRPGHNALYEALGGRAELVLVPGIPWMEGQQEFAESVARRVGAAVVAVDDYDTLEACIVERLTSREPRAARPKPKNGTVAAAAAIAAELGSICGGPSEHPHQRLVVVLPPEAMSDADALRTVRATVSKAIPIIERGSGVQHRPAADGLTRLSVLAQGSPQGPERANGSIYVDVEMPAQLSPADLAERCISLVLYVDEGDIGMMMRRWLAFAGSSRAALVDAALDRLVADPRRSLHLGWTLASGRRSQHARGLLLDCSALGESEFGAYLAALRSWLDRLRIEPPSLEQFTEARVFSLYGRRASGETEAG